VKKIYWVFIVVLLFFAGDRLFGWVLKQLTEKSQFRYSRLYQGKAKADILLVGNSRGLIFYQPHIEKITGKKTFNISYNGMPINLAEVLVKDYLEKYPAPKQMILDVSMCDRLNKSLISGFNIYTPYSQRMYDLVHLNDTTGAVAGKFFNIYRYNSEIFQRSMFYLNKSDEDWLLDRVINDVMVAGITDYKPDTIIIEEPRIIKPEDRKERLLKNITNQITSVISGNSNSEDEYVKGVMEHLAATVNFAKSKGVDVQLVINPYYPPYLDKLVNLDLLKAEAEKVTGMKVHDYSRSVTDPEGFGDYQHLNKAGSRIFLDKLKADGILK